MQKNSFFLHEMLNISSR